MGNDEPGAIDRLTVAGQRFSRKKPEQAEVPEERMFPLRVAAIDVGSNAIRFLGADFLQAQRFTTIEQIRAPVRLGRSAFDSGRLDATTMEAALATLVAFRERMNAFNIVHYRAVATSAVRDSANADEFIARVRDEADLVLEVITSAEEARLVHQAVRGRIDLGSSKWLLVDLGGGSVEVSVADSRRVRRSVSHPVGTVRMLSELTVEGDDVARFRRRVEEYLAPVTLPAHGGLSGFIATGGNGEALAALANAPQDERGVSRLALSDLRELIDELALLTPAERMTKYGMREDRADVILPGALVYERICSRAGLDEILVPGVGVREGLVLDLAAELSEHRAHSRHHDQLVWAGAHALGRHYRFDREHARHVTKLVLSLFDQLEDVHELGEADRRILTAAGLLHDIGAFVAYKRHHKHSLYLIMQAELPGLSPQEILMVANVARYHRKGHPSANHEFYMKLKSSERDRVARLAALLRIADGLDREHAQRVQGIDAHVDDGRLVIGLRGSGDLLLERWAAERKSKLLEEVFDLRLDLSSGVAA